MTRMPIIEDRVAEEIHVEALADANWVSRHLNRIGAENPQIHEAILQGINCRGCCRQHSADMATIAVIVYRLIERQLSTAALPVRG